MQVIIAALGLRERQSKQHSRCQTAFQSLSWAFRPTQSIRVASISAIHFHCSFSVCIMCSSKLSECRCEIIWTVSGSLWQSLASMQASAAARPQTHSLTSYYVKLCVCVCESWKTVVAAAHLLKLVCLWFSFDWGLVSAGSPQLSFCFTHFASLSQRSPPEPLEKEGEKILFTAGQSPFSSAACESVRATCLASVVVQPEHIWSCTALCCPAGTTEHIRFLTILNWISEEVVSKATPANAIKEILNIFKVKIRTFISLLLR